VNINDGEAFKVSGDGTLETTTQTWRKVTAESPILGGNYLVHAVPEMVAETISVWVYGQDQGDLSNNFTLLDDLFSQWDYRIRWTFDDYRETWRCQLADASYSRGQTLTHNLMAKGAGEILNSFFGQGTVPPQSYYLALMKDVAPTPYISGNEMDEPDVPSYQRIEIPNDTVNWGNNGALNITMNLSVCTFVEATEDWGTIRYWALLNASTGGNPYLVGVLESPVTVNTGDIPQMDVGEIDVELGPFFATWEV
jgi:hypothetical protein